MTAPTIHVDQEDKKDQKNPTLPVPHTTSTKQMTGYITVAGIQSETSRQEKEWPHFAMKELVENAYDFMNDYYPDAPRNERKIAVSVNIEPAEIGYLFRLKVRNSNLKNFAVFENLSATFDFNIWSSSKRNQKRIVCGALGDFLKRALGMGYASWTSKDDDPNSFEDKQWPYPLILRFNGQEHKIFLVVENQQPYSHIQPPTKIKDSDFIEVEIVLPLSETWKESHEILLQELEQEYKKNKFAKSRIEFSFHKEGLV
jgi:hypothetical protein